MAGNGKRKTPGKVVSRAQQSYLFAVHASFAKRWAKSAGEVGPHGHPSIASKAAYKALPPRKTVRKRA